MDVTSTQISPSVHLGQAGTPNTQQSVIGADFNTFLQMLTTQMKNQDPLNPIDSSEYAAQLAAFSTVEQQVVTNGLLENMSELLGLGGLAEVSTWVGQDVRSEAPAYFEGTPLELGVHFAAGAEDAQLEVFDEFGTLVQTQELAGNEDLITWAGVDEDGDPLPEGEYTFVVNNLSNEESTGLTPVHSYNQVVEARMDSGLIVLVLQGGRSIPADSVIGVRA